MLLLSTNVFSFIRIVSCRIQQIHLPTAKLCWTLGTKTMVSTLSIPSRIMKELKCFVIWRLISAGLLVQVCFYSIKTYCALAWHTTSIPKTKRKNNTKQASNLAHRNKHDANNSVLVKQNTLQNLCSLCKCDLHIFDYIIPKRQKYFNDEDTQT